MQKIIATATLYDEHGVNIWWIDEEEYGAGGHILWLPAETPTIEDGKALDEGRWGIDEADDLLAAAGYRRTEPWHFGESIGYSAKPWAEVEKD